MGKKRPHRTAQRALQRDLRKLVHDRERLAALSPGGSAEQPIEVTSTAVIELRAQALPCPQCAGRYHIDDHQAPSSVLRALTVTCQRCGVSRQLWFKIVSQQPN